MHEHQQPSTGLRIASQVPQYKWMVAASILLVEGTATFAGNSVNLAMPRLLAAFGPDVAATQ